MKERRLSPIVEQKTLRVWNEVPDEIKLDLFEALEQASMVFVLIDDITDPHEVLSAQDLFLTIVQGRLEEKYPEIFSEAVQNENSPYRKLLVEWVLTKPHYYQSEVIEPIRGHIPAFSSPK